MARKPPAFFAPRHRWDRNFFLVIVTAIWTGILMGFVPDIIDHISKPGPAFPLMVHVHAVAFVGWLCLLTVQLLLVRTGHVAWHRTLGVAGMVLAAAMVPLGIAASLAADYLHDGQPQPDPQFLSVQLGDLTSFAALAAAAFLLRRNAPAHKRLMLMATIFIADAGFDRWFGEGLSLYVGSKPFGQWVDWYISDVVLVLAIGAYDLLTRGRVLRVYVAAAAFGFSVEAASVWLYFSPWWRDAAVSIIGR